PCRFFSDGAWHDAHRYDRSTLVTGDEFAGPAIIIEPHQTVCVEPGWSGTIDADGQMILSKSHEYSDDKSKADQTNHTASRHVAKKRPEEEKAPADPVLLEVFNNLFMSIAEQMGETLRQTARSVNIKERLDFSCALFSAQGELIANAPHVPVHLGSMDSAVTAIIAAHPADTIRPGDVFALNAPYNGGTHLPDITVISPVFSDPATSNDQARIIFWVASRGHHEDVGGRSPGSMTPQGKVLDDEGVVFDGLQIVRDGHFLEDDVRHVLQHARFPARQPHQNIADLKAQIAANRRGIIALNKVISDYGLPTVSAYMAHIQNNAETSIRALLATLEGGACRLETDTGAVISVSIEIDKRRRSAIVDFSGTSDVRPDNFNAPEPVTRAAVLYVFRVLAQANIPLNAGCLKPIDIKIPDGCFLRPTYPAAVVAGNVETSQAVTNALFSALGKLGTSQATMNNVTFGDASVQYYETICSGAPAGPNFDGANAVQVHMTNTRLTDPEILELRYPVVLEEFAIDRGSGGRGLHSAGDGVRRRLRFQQPTNLSLLTSNRKVSPQGAAGGKPGRLGQNMITRANGETERLGSCAQVELAAGDALEIKTPTGGGFGKPDR
ncbi:MAG: hydantoinase B/oxoprolinase family protein, partial [Pseudomonadota bacterium]